MTRPRGRPRIASGGGTVRGSLDLRLGRESIGILARVEKKKFFLNSEPLVAKTLLLGRPVLSWATGDGLLSISVPPGRYPRPLVDMEASYGWRPASIDGRPH